MPKPAAKTAKLAKKPAKASAQPVAKPLSVSPETLGKAMGRLIKEERDQTSASLEPITKDLADLKQQLNLMDDNILLKGVTASIMQNNLLGIRSRAERILLHRSVALEDPRKSPKAIFSSGRKPNPTKSTQASPRMSPRLASVERALTGSL